MLIYDISDLQVSVVFSYFEVDEEPEPDFVFLAACLKDSYALVRGHKERRVKWSCQVFDPGRASMKYGRLYPELCVINVRFLHV